MTITDVEEICGMKAAHAVALVGKLTGKQVQVAELLAMGFSRQKVATKLDISTKEGDVHRGKVKATFDTPVHGISRIWFLAKMARSYGIVGESVDKSPPREKWIEITLRIREDELKSMKSKGPVQKYVRDLIRKDLGCPE